MQDGGCKWSWLVVSVWFEMLEGKRDVRPIEPRDLGKGIDYGVFRWPRQLRWIVGWTMLDVIRSMR